MLTKNQRGISLTNTILKVYEKILNRRIGPILKKTTTPLQGGGKEGENVEEYLLIINTIIDITNGIVKIIVTDVEKAFDKASRIHVFSNLAKHGVTGKVLASIWCINNSLRGRIKEGEERSEEFEIQDSVRQGSGLSTSNYGQHTAKVIEDVEEEDVGGVLNGRKVPIIGWQDDLNSIVVKKEEENLTVETFVKSADENKIMLSKSKCKVLIMKKKKNEETEDVKLGDYCLPIVNEVKILGFNYDEKNSSTTHLSVKEEEVREMVSALGLSLEKENLTGMYMTSFIVTYKKMIIPKIMYIFCTTLVPEN